jgi:hypothetical protein
MAPFSGLSIQKKVFQVYLRVFVPIQYKRSAASKLDYTNDSQPENLVLQRAILLDSWI